MSENSIIYKEIIKGAKNYKTITITAMMLIGGIGFLLTGFSSYFHLNLLVITDTSTIKFIPQGIVMLFYGTCALCLGLFLVFYIVSDFGSGYNEFSKEENAVRIVRLGFPGKNRNIFFSYEFKMIRSLKFLIKEGLNPRYNLLLVLKDKREIPLFPPQYFLSPKEIEKKALFLSNLLEVPIERVRVK